MTTPLHPGTGYPTTDITRLIESYRAGQITFGVLKERLAHYSYVETERSRVSRQHKGNMVEYDNAPQHTPGSWDEVRDAYDTGLLTKDEYYAISGAKTSVLKTGRHQ